MKPYVVLSLWAKLKFLAFIFTFLVATYNIDSFWRAILLLRLAWRTLKPFSKHIVVWDINWEMNCFEFVLAASRLKIRKRGYFPINSALQNEWCNYTSISCLLPFSLRVLEGHIPLELCSGEGTAAVLGVFHFIDSCNEYGGK